MGITEIIVLGFGFGLGGSLHCLGMCSPLVIGVKANQKTSWFLSLQAGKTLTYILFGAIAGAGGGILAYVVDQQVFSIAVGLVLLVGLLFSPYFQKLIPDFIGLQKVSAWIRNKLMPIVPQQSNFKYFIFGMANGFLPCGLLYGAFFAAIGTGSLHGGVLFMATFGLGTIPLMAVTSLGYNQLPWLRKMVSVNKLSGIIQLSFAILLIVRGLGLGIPYVSPAVPLQGAVGRVGYHCVANK